MAKNTQQPELSMVDQVRIRREKLAQLQQEGQNPFAQTKFEFTSNSAEIKKNFEQMEGKEVSVSGRLMTKRGMGKVMFCDLQDAAGRIQIYLKIDEMDEAMFERCRKLDIGDIVGVHGDVFRTQRGEISVRAHEVVLLAKALLPLPDKFHGLTNLETRYRQRYVDLIVNPDVKDTFVKRSLILRELRSFLDGRGFLEVDTPILTPFEIGASARPFYTHHNTLDMDMVLRIETELYLKRLIVGGMDRVYEVGRIFRNEGMDPKHNPEFTTIELYQAYTDFHGMMDLVEDMMKQVAQNVCGTKKAPLARKDLRRAPGEKARADGKAALERAAEKRVHRTSPLPKNTDSVYHGKTRKKRAARMRSPSICFLNGLLLVVLGLDDAVAAVVAAINDADRIAEIGVAEDEEAVAQQVHLQNGFLHAHGLDGEALGAHDVERALLVGFELLGQLRQHSLGAQVLGKAGLVLADLALDLGRGLVDRAAHVAVRVLTYRAEQRAVGAAEHDLGDTAVLLLDGEGDRSLGLLLEKLLELADLFLGIGLDGIVQGDFFAGVGEFHSVGSFRW